MSRDPKKQPVPPFNYTQGLYAMAQVIADAIRLAIVIKSAEHKLPTNLIAPLIEHIKCQRTCHTNWTIKHGVITGVTSSISSDEASNSLTLHSSYQTPCEITQADSIKAMLLDSAINSLKNGSYKAAATSSDLQSIRKVATDTNISNLSNMLETHRDDILSDKTVNEQVLITTNITKDSYTQDGFNALLKDSHRTGSSNSLSINGVNAKTAWNILFSLKGPSAYTKWVLFGRFCYHGFDAFCDGLREDFETLQPEQQHAFLQSIKETAISVLPEKHHRELPLPQELSIDTVIEAAKTAHGINCKTDFSKLMPRDENRLETSVSDETIKRDTTLFIRNKLLKEIITTINKNLSTLERDKDRFTIEALGLEKPLTDLKNRITSAMEAESLPQTAEAYQEEFNDIMGNEPIYKKQKHLRKRQTEPEKKPIEPKEKPEETPSKHQPLYIAFASISLVVGAAATPCIAVLLPPLFAHSVANSIYTSAALLAVITVGVAVLFAVLAGKKQIKCCHPFGKRDPAGSNPCSARNT